MPLPALIRRLTSFTAFQQGQGDNAFPGTQVDYEFDQTNNAVDALISALALTIRADGKLANGSVPRSALGADIMLGLGASRPWSSTTAYAVNDTVTRGYGLYTAIIASMNADPATSSTSWSLLADLSQAVVVADGSISTSKIPDLAITEPKLATGAVSTRALGGAVVTRANMVPAVGLVPVGGEMDYAGYIAPVGWLFCAGQAVSRTTYPDLFATLSPIIAADTAIGSTTLANATVISGLGFRGAVVEGVGIPAGATLVSDANGNVTISAAATAAGSQIVIRLFPYGRGNGSTTFNVPDRRGRVTIGRDDMTGAGAGRFVQPFDGANLSSTGGATMITLTNALLPVAMPAQQVTVGYAPQTYVRYQNLIGVSQGAGGTTAANVWQGYVADNTGGAAAQTFGVTNTNPGGGNAFALVQPTSVANRIIFAGV